MSIIQWFIALIKSDMRMFERRPEDKKQLYDFIKEKLREKEIRKNDEL